MSEVRRLLIRAPNWIGDVVLSLDAVRESAGTAADARALRGAFDAAVLLPNSIGSAVAPWWAGIPERWGYATDARGPLLTRAPKVPAGVRGWSEVYYYRAMLAGVGLEVSASPDTSLRCPSEWNARGASLLGDTGTAFWIGLNPGAAFGTAKRWIPERYAGTADVLARRTGAHIAIVGGPADRPLAQRIAGNMRTRPRVLCGETSLPDLVGVLSHLRLLITNDSGPMHLAAALGVPVVAVFGPTDWRETAPRGEKHRVVRESVDCAPCKLRDCPIDHRCMRRVTLDRVVAEAEAALS